MKRKMKNLKETLASTKKVEQNVRTKRGKKSKSVGNSILGVLGTNYGIYMSSYHRGDMEGPSIRKLMRQGREVFQSVVEHILSMERSKKIELTEDEIRDSCATFANSFVLLDGAIFLVNTKREVNEILLQDFLTAGILSVRYRCA